METFEDIQNSRLNVLNQIIEGYIDEYDEAYINKGTYGEEIKNLIYRINHGDDIEEALVEFVSSCDWCSWPEIVEFTIRLKPAGLPYIDLCIYYIEEQEYNCALICFDQAGISLREFTKHTHFFTDDRDHLFYQFLAELGFAYIVGEYDDVPVNPEKGFKMIYDYIEDYYYYILPEKHLHDIMNSLYVGCVRYESLRENICKLLDISEENNYNEEVFDIVKDLASQGNLDAQYYLGWFYRDGIGTAPNDKCAVEIWEAIAGKTEYIGVLKELAVAYDKGIGCEINKVKAREYKKAWKKRKSGFKGEIVFDFKVTTTTKTISNKKKKKKKSTKSKIMSTLKKLSKKIFSLFR
jgi:hypothetical protein